MNLMNRIIQTLFIIAVLTFFSQSAFTKLTFPYDTEAFNADISGNSAGRNSGGYFRRPAQGYFNLIYWIGTNITPGSLTLDFEYPFTDGIGKDFAILTHSESWGPLADIAKFEFFLDDTLQGSFEATLRPDELFEFELPGNGIIANKVVITDITPDPPGINDLATMTFIDAGVAYSVGTISGIVTEKETGNPVKDATVTTNGYSNTTDPTGSYTIMLPAGNYTLTASKDGYEEKSEEDVMVEIGDLTIVNFSLNKNAKNLEEVSIYPSPYVKGKSAEEKITFANLPKEATIRIYSLSGQLVKEIKHRGLVEGENVKWDVRGIGSGIYFYTIVSSQKTEKGKISIIK